MKNYPALALPGKYLNPSLSLKEIETEFIRKAIHILVAFIPVIASINKTFSVAFLAAGVVFYTFSEYLRCNGGNIIIISRITQMASRDRDKGRFVLGPVTLGIGALLALMLYPAPAATIAIYALAFGDSIASVIGKIFGRIRLPYSGGKTLAGSLACLTVVTFTAYRITGSFKSAIILGSVATLLEALPTGDLDNIIIPTGTGLAAYQIITHTL